MTTSTPTPTPPTPPTPPTSIGVATTVMTAPSDGSSLTALWERVVASALLGTERRPLRPTAPERGDHELGLLEHQVRASECNPAEELLAIGALVHTIRRAGQRPNPADPAATASLSTSPEDAEDQSLVRSSAAQILDVVLSGTVAVEGLNDTLIMRWIEGCARAGHRVPNGLIVPLLERATQHSALRPSTALVIGARGRYVANHNPQWKWVRSVSAAREGIDDSGEISADRLAEADPLTRVSMFATWRSRDPHAARIALTARWSGEASTDRRDFVRALYIGLDATDEGLLEQCLDDRAKTVREAAQELLAALPTSAYALRMAARLEPLVRVKRFPRFSVTCELPTDELDQAATRDGLTRAETRARAELLRQIVSAVPVSWWSRHCGRSLADVTDAVRNTDTADEVLSGICQSAARSTAARPSPDEHADLLHLWREEMGVVDAGIRSGAAAFASLKRCTLLETAFAGHRDDLVGACFEQNWLPGTVGTALGRLLGDHLVAPATARKILRWARRNSGDVETLLTHPIELLVASLSIEDITELSRYMQADAPMQHRLRRLQAAGSFLAAISKEFP